MNDYGTTGPMQPPAMPTHTQPSPAPHAGAPIGVSISLSPAQVGIAQRKRAYDIARARGMSIPVDEAEFMVRAVVHPRADGGSDVTLEV